MKNNTAFIILLYFFNSCTLEVNDNIVTPDNLSGQQTKNVVLVVIDGPRYSETWGDNTFDNIPYQKMLSKQGVFFDNFHNDGVTFTLSGHTAITTGVYEEVTNNGTEIPTHPSIFQYFLSYNKLSPEKSWIITSKSKLHALADTKDINWRGSYTPSTDAVDRYDKDTFEKSLSILEEYQPELTMIHFRGPDKMGHRNDWKSYIEKIRETDKYVYQIWDHLQSIEHYKDNTTMLVTCDHGRHLNGIGSGFVGHGDGCEGCRHIYLLAIGPDIEKGKTISDHFGLIDIAPTIAQLMNISFKGEGQIIPELINQ